MTKRIFAMLLAVVMVVGLLPMNVFAGTAADRTKYTAPLAAHDSSLHICEHCVAADGTTATPPAEGWTPWGDDEAEKTSLPKQAGHYYLTGPINPTTYADPTSGDVVICLNGQTLTANGSETKNDRFYYLKGSANLTIVDCTASGEGDTYKAGKLTGATSSAIMTYDASDTSRSTGSVNIYDGIFDGNSRNTSAGGALAIQGNTTLNIYGGRFANNTAGYGGAINTIRATNAVYIEDAVFTGNVGNEGAGAICAKGPLTLKNVTVRNNTTKGSTAENGLGAISLCATNAQTITLKGDVKIENNTNGDTTNPVKRNLYLTNAANRVAVSNLADTASVGVAMAGGMGTFAENVTDAGAKDRFASDVDGIYVHAQANTLVLSDVVPAPPHSHCVCGVKGCTDTNHGGDVVFKAWGDNASEKTSLPTTEDNYYLTDDVTLSATYSLDSIDLNLCLNGHNIYIADGVSGRQFYVKGDSKLSITDCDADGDGKTGALMNGTSGAIMSHTNANGAEVNLYRIGLKKNSRQNAGGTIAAQGNTTFNLTDVEISGSSATGNGGVFYADKTAKINITGGSIHDNRATGNGGVFVLTSESNKLTVKGTEFKKNTTAKNGGVLYTEKACTVSFENCTFTQNHADSGEGGVAYLKTAKATFTGGTMEQNTAKNGSALVLFGGTSELNGTKIRSNVASSSYGAVHINRIDGKVSVTMQGATEISGNTTAAGKSQNVFLRNNASYINMAGLTSGANIFVTMEDDRMKSGYWNISADTVTEEQASRIHSDNGDYTVKLANNKARLSSGHDHTVCVDANCSDNHDELGWIKWTDTTKLPTTAGYYYLAGDIQLNGEQPIKEDVHICLNGKTVMAKENSRLISLQSTIAKDGTVSEAGNLVITDCMGGGKLTGGSKNFGGAVNMQQATTLKLYGGIISGNTAKLETPNKNVVKDEEGNVVYESSFDLGTAGAVYMASNTLYKLTEGGTIQKKKPDADVAYETVDGVGAKFYMYGGQIGEENLPNEAMHGGAVYISKGASFEVFGGKLACNKADNEDKDSGTVFDDEVDEDGKGGAVYVAGEGSFKLHGGSMENNTATKGGAIYATKDSIVEAGAAKITRNTAEEAGAAYLTRSNVTMSGTEIAENTGKNGSALCIFSTDITLKDVKIQNNHATSGYGAVHVNMNNREDVDKNIIDDKFTVSGSTVIANNTVGEAKTAQNVYLRNCDRGFLTLGGLTSGANIGVTMEASRLRANKLDITTEGTTGEQAAFLHSQSAGYDLKVVNGKARLVTGHDHNVCVDSKCADKHENLTWVEWTDSTKLPTAGNYYLGVDVKMQEAGSLTGTLNLCLNGHTVTAKEGGRILSVTGTGELSVTDCTGKGVLTGGDSIFGGAINVNSGGVLSLYAGNITGNQARETVKDAKGKVTYKYSEGGAIYVQGGKSTETKTTDKQVKKVTNKDGVEERVLFVTEKTSRNNLAGGIVNMYGGTISGNTANVGGAVRTASPNSSAQGIKFDEESEDVAKDAYDSRFVAQFNMYGGKIADNTAKAYGGAVAGSHVVTNLMGGEITGNISNSYGAVYTATKTDLTVGGNVQILGNTMKGRAANLYLDGQGLVAMDNLAADARIGVSVAKYDRVISKANDTDYTKNFISDSPYRVISYKDKALYLANSTEHTHCTCAGVSIGGCKHDSVVWTAWESNDALPETDGYYYLVNDIKLNKAYNNISADVKLCLNGFTVTAKDGVRLLGIANEGVYSIADCQGTGVLTGGNNNFGGAIKVNAGGTLNLFGGTITGNQSNDSLPLPERTDLMKGEGGAIYLQKGKEGLPGGVLNMYGGTITGNKASLGGGIYAAATTSLNIYGGTISNNQAVAYGGATYSTGGIVTNIENAKFECNTANTGGAVYITGSGSKLNVKNTTFHKNVAQHAAGAILAQSKQTVIDINGCTFTGNQSIGSGGAVYASTNTTLKLDNSTFTGNTAEQGASLYALRATSTVGKVTMEGNKTATTKEKPTLRAAGVYVSGGEMTIDGAVFKNNQGGSGTAITTGGAKATVNGEQVMFYPTVNFVSGTISGNKGTSGGAILLQGKTVFDMKGGQITGNSASEGGAIYVSTNATFNMTGGTISGNSVKNNGGAIYALRSEVNLKSGTIKNNVAEKMGGAIFLSGAKLHQSGVTISGNKTGTGGGAIATGIRRDGDNKYEPYIKISGGTISNNSGKHGGAILLQGNDKTVLDMTGGKITNNQCKVDGGAIYASTNTTVNMTGGTITGNTSEGRSGAIHHLNSEGNYTNVEICGNSSKTSAGAMVVTGIESQVKMKNVKLYDHSSATAGTILVQGKAKLTLEKVEIYNSASTGTAGAIYISTNSYLNVIDSNIHDCKAENYGGALYFANHTHVNVDGLTLQNNATKAEGGGIYTRGVTSFYKNMKLIGNTASGNGAGFHMAYPAVQGVTGMIIKPDFKTGNVMENVQFQDNHSDMQGGGLYVHKGGFVTLKNAEFTGNTSGMEGSAVYAQGDFIMNGMTATGNTSKMDGYAVYLADVEYDNHSYTSGLNRMAGDVIVKDNQGGDMYLGETTTIVILPEGLSEKAEIHVTLASGVLTNKVQGAYHYEGGDLVYVITYGDRSLTEPEYDEALANKNKEDSAIGDVLLYVGIGVFVLAIAAVVVVLILKKKKKAPVADGAQE